MFTPVQQKIDQIIPDTKEIDTYNYLCKIVRAMIENGHKAHMTIPGYDKCKPEVEAFKVFDGLEIPVHGYSDHKGDIIIEDKCKFPRKGIVKKDGTRSWITNKLPNTVESTHLPQIDFYHYATGLPVYICYINEKEFKVFHADNCDLLKPENIKSRLPSFIQKCKVRQNLLSISNDINVIKNYILPDFDNFRWKNELMPELLADAKKFWGY